MSGKMLGEILPFYIVSFIGLYLYFSVSTVVDIKGKRRVLRVNLVDYLENHLSARMDVTENDLDMLYGMDRSYRRERIGKRTVELMPIGGRITAAPADLPETAVTVTEEELETLLKEFLAT